MTKQEDVAFMTQRELDELLEYSTTLPTGTTIGKVWKRKQITETGPAWWLGEYVEETDPHYKAKGYVGIKWRRIVIGEPAAHLDYQI